MDKFNVISLNLSANDYVCPQPIEKLQQDPENMIPWGDSNLFPQDLLGLVERTSLVSSIIDKITKYIIGDGVDSQYNGTVVDDKGTLFEEFIEGIVNDYITFGAFATQVRRNTYGDIKKLDRLRIERIRTNEENTKFWYSKKWSKFSKANLVYDAFNGSKEQNDSIFYYKNPSSRHIYGFAPYWSALDDITTALALSEYGTNTVNNCFAPSAIISLVEGKPTPDEAKVVEKDLNEKFSGTKNNAKLLVTFSDTPEGAPKITSFQAADINAHYLSLKDQVKENIYAAFNIDPILVGVHTTDGIFSQEAFEQSFKLFNKTEIEPIQRNLIKAMRKLGYEISFKPFTIDWENDFVSPSTENNVAENGI